MVSQVSCNESISGGVHTVGSQDDRIVPAQAAEFADAGLFAASPPYDLQLGQPVTLFQVGGVPFMIGKNLDDRALVMGLESSGPGIPKPVLVLQPLDGL